MSWGEWGQVVLSEPQPSHRRMSMGVAEVTCQVIALHSELSLGLRGELAGELPVEQGVGRGSACRSQWAAESPSQSGGVGAGKQGLREAREEVEVGGATGGHRSPCHCWVGWGCGVLKIQTPELLLPVQMPAEPLPGCVILGKPLHPCASVSPHIQQGVVVTAPFSGVLRSALEQCPPSISCCWRCCHYISARAVSLSGYEQVPGG